MEALGESLPSLAESYFQSFVKSGGASLFLLFSQHLFLVTYSAFSEPSTILTSY